jgi:hypothetical protein
LPPGEFKWFVLAHDGDQELVAATYRASVATWTAEQIAAAGAAEGELGRWARLYSPRTPEGLQQAAAAERLRAQRWLQARMSPRAGARKGR